MKKILTIALIVLIFIAIIILLKLPYRFFYNYGNNFYNTARYETAINMYDISLKLFAPEKDRCDIRVNKALCILKKIENYTDKYEHKEDIFKILDEAERVLCEEGCAHKEDSNGHDKEAQQLEDDIKKFRKSLENPEEEKGKGDNSEDQDEGKPEEQQQVDPTKKEKMKEVMDQGKGKKENEERRDSYYKNSDTSYYGRKRW